MLLVSLSSRVLIATRFANGKFLTAFPSAGFATQSNSQRAKTAHFAARRTLSSAPDNAIFEKTFARVSEQAMQNAKFTSELVAAMRKVLELNTKLLEQYAEQAKQNGERADKILAENTKWASFLAENKKHFP